MDKTKSRKIWHCIIAYRLGDKKKKRKTHRGIDGNNAYKKVQKSCTFIF